MSNKKYSIGSYERDTKKLKFGIFGVIVLIIILLVVGYLGAPV